MTNQRSDRGQQLQRDFLNSFRVGDILPCLVAPACRQDDTELYALRANVTAGTLDLGLDCCSLLSILQMAASEAVVSMPLQLLPAEIVEAVCSFLSGFDAFQLSHTSAWWMCLLSDGLRWRERVVHGPVPANQHHLLHSWKRRYILAKSMLFHGLGADDIDDLALASYACVEYPPPTEWGQFRWRHFALRALHAESFSFDLWLCLLPSEKDAVYTGGVIFGLQSEERDSSNWPKYHQQFIVVDSKSNLYCSVLDTKEPVAKDLEYHRWYHITLTYDRDRQHQDVYVNGVKTWSTTGALHREWHHLLHEQVGTGYVTAGSGDFPHPNFVGWYGFHGLLDDFRFWSGALTLHDVHHLARGGELPPKRRCGSLKYPGLRGPQSGINVDLVSCTRPAEGRAIEVFNYSHFGEHFERT